MTFRFRYQSLLDLRLAAEEAAQRELAGGLGERAALEAQLADMDGAILRSKADLGASLVGRVDLRAVAGVARLGADQAIRRREIGLQLDAMEAELDRRRDAVRAARAERRKLEVLRDRDRAAWQTAQNRREQNALDEAAARIAIGGAG